MESYKKFRIGNGFDLIKSGAFFPYDIFIN